jgi:spore photoproduct lyase
MGKLEEFYNNTLWEKIDKDNARFLINIDNIYKLTYQEWKQTLDIVIDFQAWGYSLQNICSGFINSGFSFKSLRDSWNNLKDEPKDYSNFTPSSDFIQKPVFTETSPDRTILGDCPVASEKTRCCNLKTLDAVINCGFDCSYCTIQSFYKGGKILFQENLVEKLNNLKLDPQKKHHIGTGQSSDSLMWGNRENLLKNLFDFASKNKNVALELKTKSDNIGYLLENPIPRNVITTWSLNTPTIIKNEEHLTASLEKRLESAKIISKKGGLIGFHFHPMVYYKNWEEEYREVAERIIRDFDPKNVVMISIGTLTFIKPVIKKIRARDFKTKILQMPLVDAEGKFSYPYNIKRDMFSVLYNFFKPWHNKVFFYMCMEDVRLWKDVFGREYSSNTAFEDDMLEYYFTKINN